MFGEHKTEIIGGHLAILELVTIGQMLTVVSEIAIEMFADIQRDGAALLVEFPSMLHLIISLVLHHGLGKGGNANEGQ